MTQTRILIVPGRGNSEPEHWQSIVESRLPGTLRILQADWNEPKLNAWSKNIDRAVRALDHPPLVVAHSFGCLAAAYAQIALGTPVGATLFVAPADPERFGLSRSIFGEALTQSGLLIASDNDPWLSLEKAKMLAADWGVECINLGSAGHINVTSGFGQWPFGETIITSMHNELTRGDRSQTFKPRQHIPAHHVCRSLVKPQSLVIDLLHHMQIRKKSFVADRQIDRFELALGMNAGVCNDSRNSSHGRG